MKKIFTLLLICSWISHESYGQEFTYHSDSPFGIQIVRNDGSRASQKLIFSDYDQDGDLDLFLTGLDSLDDADPLTWEHIHYFIDMQENIGDQWNPQFAERMSLENFPFPLGYFLPTGGDLNNDGKTDFITFASVDFIGNRTGAYIRNNGDNTFESIRLDAMALTDFVPESLFFPELLDLDSDGDLDLLMSGFDSAIAEEDGADVPVYYYAKNIGTPSTPDLLGWYDNPYGLMPIPLAEILTGGDIDNDGDVDIIGASIVVPEDSMNYLYVHLNNPGTNGKPAFDAVLQSPYGLPSSFGTAQLIAPTFVDINSDGDLDLFVFTGTADSQALSYYENNACEPETNTIFAEICEGDNYKFAGNTYTEAGVYPIPLTGSDGCDSTIVLTLELLPTYTISLNESICQGESFVVGNESFTDEGAYTVSLVAGNGCDSTINLSLEVQPTYSVPINETICAGESFVIGNETFTEPGDYTVFMIAANGCDSIILLSLEVHNVDNSVTLQENTLTANEPFASYQWFDCDSGENIPGATNQTYVALVTGNYAVSLIDGFGCSAVSQCFLVIVTSVEENIISNAITLYPNPSQGVIYLKNESRFPVSSIILTNMYGQQVGEFFTDGTAPVDIGNFGKGVFFIKIKIKGQEIIRKLAVF